MHKDDLDHIFHSLNEPWKERDVYGRKIKGEQFTNLREEVVAWTKPGNLNLVLKEDDGKPLLLSGHRPFNTRDFLLFFDEEVGLLRRRTVNDPGYLAETVPAEGIVSPAALSTQARATTSASIITSAPTLMARPQLDGLATVRSPSLTTEASGFSRYTIVGAHDSGGTRSSAAVLVRSTPSAAGTQSKQSRTVIGAKLFLSPGESDEGGNQDIHNDATAVPADHSIFARYGGALPPSLKRSICQQQRLVWHSDSDGPMEDGEDESSIAETPSGHPVADGGEVDEMAVNCIISAPKVASNADSHSQRIDSLAHAYETPEGSLSLVAGGSPGSLLSLSSGVSINHRPVHYQRPEFSSTSISSAGAEDSERMPGSKWLPALPHTATSSEHGSTTSLPLSSTSVTSHCSRRSSLLSMSSASQDDFPDHAISPTSSQYADLPERVQFSGSVTDPGSGGLREGTLCQGSMANILSQNSTEMRQDVFMEDHLSLPHWSYRTLDPHLSRAKSEAEAPGASELHRSWWDWLSRFRCAHDAARALVGFEHLPKGDKESGRSPKRRRGD